MKENRLKYSEIMERAMDESSIKWKMINETDDINEKNLLVQRNEIRAKKSVKTQLKLNVKTSEEKLEIENLKSNALESRKETEDLRQKIAESLIVNKDNLETDNLQQKYIESENHLKKRVAEVETIQKEIDNLRKQNFELNAEITRLNSNALESRKETEDLRQQIAENLFFKFQNLQQNNDVILALKEIEKKYSDMEKKYQDISLSLSKKEKELGYLLDDFEKERICVVAAQKTSRQLQLRLNDSEQQCSFVLKEMELLRKEFFQINLENQEKIDLLVQKNGINEKENNELEDSVIKITEEKKKSDLEVKSLKAKLESSFFEIESLRKEYDERKLESDEIIDQLTQKLEANENEIKELQDSILNFTDEKKKSDLELKLLKTQLKSSAHDLSYLQNLNNESSHQIERNLFEMKNKVEKIETELSAKKQENTDLTRKLKQIEKDFDFQIEKHNEETKYLNKTINELKSKLKEREETLLKDTIDRIASQENKELKENDELKEINKKLHHEKIALLNSLNRLESQIELENLDQKNPKQTFDCKQENLGYASQLGLKDIKKFDNMRIAAIRCSSIDFDEKQNSKYDKLSKKKEEEIKTLTSKLEEEHSELVRVKIKHQALQDELAETQAEFFKEKCAKNKIERQRLDLARKLEELDKEFERQANLNDSRVRLENEIIKLKQDKETLIKNHEASFDKLRTVHEETVNEMNGRINQLIKNINKIEKEKSQTEIEYTSARSTPFRYTPARRFF